MCTQPSSPKQEGEPRPRRRSSNQQIRFQARNLQELKSLLRFAFLWVFKVSRCLLIHRIDLDSTRHSVDFWPFMAMSTRCTSIKASCGLRLVGIGFSLSVLWNESGGVVSILSVRTPLSWRSSASKSTIATYQRQPLKWFVKSLLMNSLIINTADTPAWIFSTSNTPRLGAGTEVNVFWRCCLGAERYLRHALDGIQGAV